MFRRRHELHQIAAHWKLHFLLHCDAMVKFLPFRTAREHLTYLRYKVFPVCFWPSNMTFPEFVLSANLTIIQIQTIFKRKSYASGWSNKRARRGTTSGGSALKETPKKCSNHIKKHVTKWRGKNNRSVSFSNKRYPRLQGALTLLSTRVATWSFPIVFLTLDIKKNSSSRVTHMSTLGTWDRPTKKQDRQEANIYRHPPPKKKKS